MLEFAKDSLERLSSGLACHLRGFSLCRVTPWIALLLLGWMVFSR